ncbi:MAG: hypothetical protein ACE5HI_14085 [bacterium]
MVISRKVDLQKPGFFHPKLIKIEDGIGFAFKEKWSAPFSITGNDLPPIEFRSGNIMLVEGDVIISNGTQAKVDQGNSNFDYYIYQNGRWKKTET